MLIKVAHFAVQPDNIHHSLNTKRVCLHKQPKTHLSYKFEGELLLEPRFPATWPTGAPAREAGLGLARRAPQIIPVNMGALIIRIGFWGILYYSYNKEPPNPILIIKASILYGLGTWSSVVAYLNSVPSIASNQQTTCGHKPNITTWRPA